MSSVALSTDELEGLLAELRYFKTKFPRALKYTRVLDKTYSLAAGASANDVVVLDPVYQFTNLDILIFASGTASGRVEFRSFVDTAKVKAIPNSTSAFQLSVSPGSATAEWNFLGVAVGDRIPLFISNADTTNPNTIVLKIWVKLSD